MPKFKWDILGDFQTMWGGSKQSMWPFQKFFCIVSNYYHGNWDYDYCNKKITLCSIKGFTATLQVLMSSFWPKRLWHFQRDDKWHLSHVSQKCICYCVLSHKLENNNVIALLFWFDRKNYFSDDDNWFALHLVQTFFFLKVPNKGGIKTLFLVKRKDVSLPFTLLILPPPQFSEPFKIESSHTYASEASFEKKNVVLINSWPACVPKIDLFTFWFNS